jgi:carboxymethylenebutenolidase
MIESQVEIATPDGRMNTFLCHPERAGPHPVVVFLMDAPGIREELRDMARRLGTVGYYVMLPNLYYREGEEELGDFIGAAGAATREKMMRLMATLSIPMVMSDVGALLDYAAADEAAAKGPAGAVGYCMSGRYAVSAAIRFPERVKAAASIYGVRLMTDRPDSPHLGVRGTAAEYYVAWAEIDHYAPLGELEPFKRSLEADGVKAEVELYPKVEHGFAFPERPAYDKAAAERHWERLIALFDRNLRARGA